LSFDYDALRPGETTIELPQQYDAGLYFIGRIRTPWQRREDCPRSGAAARAPEDVCTIEIDPRYVTGLAEVANCDRLLVLYWMDQARRDLMTQTRRHDGRLRGTFALRSPVRPNPIAASVVTLIGVDGTRLRVLGLDCLDGTPLLDLKPEFAANHTADWGHEEQKIEG
jgi:tRNA (adenine37-N6)-methyltransferase